MSKKPFEILKTILSSKEHINIKFLGDSITHGVGGTGFEQNGEKIVEGFARNLHGHCWANSFKKYMESHFGCTVTNNACTGTNIQFVLGNFGELVSESDDIVFCTIGTNNRHQGFDEGDKHTREEHGEIFYRHLLKLNERFKEKNIPVIFIANIPASKNNEQDGDGYWRILHMDDINTIYKHASEVCDFPLISFYDLFSDYCAKENKSVDSLLADGLHPNDQGYDVMYSLLINELQLND